MYDGLTLFRPGFIDYCNAWQVRFWVCCALDPLRNVIAKRVCLFASVNGSRDRLWLVCTQYEAESFRVLFMAAQQQVSAWVGERLCGLGDHWRGTACHTRRSARHVCHLYTVLELTSKNWGSAAEMFEILPRDWSFWLIFTQKWASVDMNWEGVNPPTPRQFQPWLYTFTVHWWVPLYNQTDYVRSYPAAAPEQSKWVSDLVSCSRNSNYC